MLKRMMTAALALAVTGALAGCWGMMDDMDAPGGGGGVVDTDGDGFSDEADDDDDNDGITDRRDSAPKEPGVIEKKPAQE